MLDAYRDSGSEFVEDRPVEWTGHRLVMVNSTATSSGATSTGALASYVL
jgi:hypothetical protein